MKISAFYQNYCLKQDSLDIDIHMQNVKDMADVYEKKEKGIRVQSMLFSGQFILWINSFWKFCLCKSFDLLYVCIFIYTVLAMFQSKTESVKMITMLLKGRFQKLLSVPKSLLYQYLEN